MAGSGEVAGRSRCALVTIVPHRCPLLAESGHQRGRGLGRFIEGRPDDLFWLLADMQRRWPLSTKLRPTQSERFRRKRQVQNLLGLYLPDMRGVRRRKL